MANIIPSTMQAIALPTYCKPSEYSLASIPVPQINLPDDILIKVHATSINPADVKTASGLTKMIQADSFPYKIGYDVAGTVAAIGSSVTSFKVGDEIYTRIPNEYRGSVAEYALSRESDTAFKPEGLDFNQAASIPLAALTALQSIEKADRELPGGLKGKTVFIPAGLGGTGSFAVQLAKNVFGAGRVITTLSTKKIEMAKKIFGDSRIEYVDYTKGDVVTAVGKNTVDFMFDTVSASLTYLPVMKKGGVIVSISAVPSGSLLKDMYPKMPFILTQVLNFTYWIYTWWIGLAGVQYSFIFQLPSGKGLVQLASYVKEGKISPIVGRTAKLSDIKAVREGCQEVYDAKGGIGKFVIEID